MACHLPQHSCHQLCHRPPDDWPDRRRSLIGRFKPSFQQYQDEEPLSNTSYKSAISSIHQDAVRTVIESSSSKLLNGQSPPIATAEQTLPRKMRTILAQLLTGHSRILGHYIKRINPTACNHCHKYGGGGGVDPIPCVSTHRISDPRSGPAQLLPPHVKQRSHPHGVRPQIPDR